jgi:hypothetical protein
LMFDTIEESFYFHKASKLCNKVQKTRQKKKNSGH